MKQLVSGAFRMHQLFPLFLLVLGGAWLYIGGHQIWQGLQAMQWPAKQPELPGEPVSPVPLAASVALTMTRDRPLFWGERRPPLPPGEVSKAAAEQPRLLGIVMASGQVGWAVLSQGAPPQRKVFRLKVGQSAGGYTLTAVRSGDVELMGPAGSVLLRPPRVASP